VQVPVAVDNVDSQPRYLIEFLATIDQTANPYEVGQGYPTLNETINIFRVTARGVGGSDTAQVLLQSSFGLIAN
jgi:type IV pilus assembly protein PilX